MYAGFIKGVASTLFGPSISTRGQAKGQGPSVWHRIAAKKEPSYCSEQLYKLQSYIFHKDVLHVYVIQH